MASLLKKRRAPQQFSRHASAGARGRALRFESLEGRRLLAVTSGDFNIDGAVDGSDFLSWQRGAGTATTAAALTQWSENFGELQSMTTIMLEGSSIAVNGNGASVSGTTVTITAGGNYKI